MVAVCPLVMRIKPESIASFSQLMLYTDTPSQQVLFTSAFCRLALGVRQQINLHLRNHINFEISSQARYLFHYLQGSALRSRILDHKPY